PIPARIAPPLTLATRRPARPCKAMPAPPRPAPAEAARAAFGAGLDALAEAWVARQAGQARAALALIEAGHALIDEAARPAGRPRIRHGKRRYTLAIIYRELAPRQPAGLTPRARLEWWRRHLEAAGVMGRHLEDPSIRFNLYRLGAPPSARESNPEPRLRPRPVPAAFRQGS
ncbi:hypothetical protein, partial [Neoroseomonas rubea]|uniref:hypothetical protein n=1 Tax=Neoroseomonas rubea TaxID=2748666 RepID=UPI0018DF4B70